MFMDETMFQIDQQQLAEGCRRFPARRRNGHDDRPRADLRPLRRASAFDRQAWDEGGHL